MPTTAERQDGWRHVEYEYGHFKKQITLARDPPADLKRLGDFELLRNALYVSAMVHLRNLCAFFGGGSDDDILASHYVDWRDPLPSVLEDVKRIAHKQIAHLTYDRNRLEGPKGQMFPWADIEAALDAMVEAFNKTPPNPQLERAIISVPGPLTTTGTNTVSTSIGGTFDPAPPPRRSGSK